MISPHPSIALSQRNTFTLKDDPMCFWLISISPCLPPNQFEALFDCLVEFVVAMVEKDDHFVIFPYYLSDYDHPEDLPPPINDPDMVPDDIDKWLQYFSQAKPCLKGGDLYMLALVGFSKPFPKVMKALALWFPKKKYGIWQSAL